MNTGSVYRALNSDNDGDDVTSGGSPFPDTCGSHRKGSDTDGAETCRWIEQRAQTSTPTAAAAGNQRQRHGEVARRGTVAPSREDSDIRAPSAGTRYAIR